MIDLSVDIAEKTYLMDSDAPKGLAIPLRFNGPQPSFFGAPLAHGDCRNLLNLQLRAFHSNAAPCRPLIFALNPE